MDRAAASLLLLLVPLPVAAFAACSSSSGGEQGSPVEGGTTDSPNGTDSPSPPGDDGGPQGDGDAGPLPDGPQGLPFQCAATSSPPAPSACPAPTGTAGHVSFCYRAQWAGVTSVDVYGGFGQPTDWQAPFLSLKNDGTGTFTGNAPLADGSYPYLFRTHGSADNLVQDGHYFLDQYNPSFVPGPPNAPVKRSVSSVTVPQVAAPVAHIKGTILYGGKPQSCYSIDVEAGELMMGSMVLSEHYTANYVESGLDGTFDFPVASSGPYGVIVRFPFLLKGADAGYPDPSSTPSAGYGRTGVTLTGADVTLDPFDVAYSAADYAALMPTGGTATLPVTFTFTVLPGASAANVAVIGTSIAGNDPAYWSPYGTATSVVWDGGFGGTQGSAKLGTKYYWGTWQRRSPALDGGATWAEESLLYPITFH